jgi:hypothetical protein
MQDPTQFKGGLSRLEPLTPGTPPLAATMLIPTLGEAERGAGTQPLSFFRSFQNSTSTYLQQQEQCTHRQACCLLGLCWQDLLGQSRQHCSAHQ